MRTEAKAAVKNSIGRLMFAALGFVIQVVWIIMLCLKLNDYSAGNFWEAAFWHSAWHSIFTGKT